MLGNITLLERPVKAREYGGCRPLCLVRLDAAV